MKCSKCNLMNPSGVEFCQSCSHELVGGGTANAYKHNNFTTSLMFCLKHFFSFIRFLILPVLMGLLDPLIGAVSFLEEIIRGIISWRAKKKGRLKKSKFWFAVRTVCWLFLFAFGIFLNLDAPPLDNEYTIEDLRSAEPENDYSFELLKSLAINEKIDLSDVIGMAAEDANSIEVLEIYRGKSDFSVMTDILIKNEELIQRAWASCLRGRKAINILSEFDEIADLTEPRLDAELDYLYSLKYLVQLYNSYVMLQCEKGNSEQAVRELIQIDQMSRKLSVNCRSVLTRIVCIAGIAIDINSANYIANHPKTSPEALKLLSKHFVKLNVEQISPRNLIISEYLMFKTEIEKMKESRTEYESWCLTKRRMLKVNSSKKLYLSIISEPFRNQNLKKDEKYSPMSVWPWGDEKLGPVDFNEEGEFPLSYYYYNPMGSMFVMILAPTLNKVFDLHTKLQIEDDLLQIVIGKRLGREVDLSARAYGDEYVVDLDAEMIYSPGKDGKAFTGDDIKLYIDPAVLGLK